MNLLSLIALAMSFLLAMIASWALLLPFFEAEESSSAVPSADETRADLLLKKESVLDALEDLQSDHRNEKITDAQFAESKSELTAQAAEILRQLEPAVAVKNGPEEERKVLKRSR